MAVPERPTFRKREQFPKTFKAAKPKEIHPGSIIRQVSFGLACIEEGPHIPRTIRQLTARQEIPEGTDVLIAISDNGSRGAWKLIETASILQKQERELRSTMDPAFADDFAQLTETQKHARLLQYHGTQDKPDEIAIERIEQQREDSTKKLAEALPHDQKALLTSFVAGEEQYRQDLFLALTNPEVFIHQTDIFRPPLILSQEPTFWQQETIREYAAILSGKYKLPKNIRIQLASGSEMGNFGSVKEVARRVAADDFRRHHSDASPQSHAVFIGDMDTHYPDERLVKGLIECFSRNPDAPVVKAKVGIAWNSRRKPGEVRFIPIPALVSTIFGNITNFGAFFQEEGRKPGHIVPISTDFISHLLQLPHLFIGPAIIFRDGTLTFAEIADQGEDLWISSILNCLFPRRRFPRHRDVSIGFNTRGAQENPLRLLTDFHAAITPYKHQELERNLGDKYMKFRKGIFGYGHRLPLAGEIIRQVEENRYHLQPNEYVDTYHASTSGRFRRKLQQNSADQRIITVRDNTTQYYFQARVNQLPAIILQQHEYVARELSQKEFARKQDKLYRGERITSYDGKQFLIRTHLQKDDAPRREIFVATA